MKFPYTVFDQLDEPLCDRWRVSYQDLRDRPRYVEEGLWRRTQEPRNADKSGWRGPGDARRRLMHYRYSYALDSSAGATRLVLTEFYVFHSVAYPAAELAVHRENVARALTDGGWSPVADALRQRGDLRCVMTTALALVVFPPVVNVLG